MTLLKLLVLFHHLFATPYKIALCPVPCRLKVLMSGTLVRQYFSLLLYFLNKLDQTFVFEYCLSTLYLFSELFDAHTITTGPNIPLLTVVSDSHGHSIRYRIHCIKSATKKFVLLVM